MGSGIGITFRGLLKKQLHTCSFWFNKLGVGLQNLQFLQVPMRCWCCWSWDTLLRITRTGSFWRTMMLWFLKKIVKIGLTEVVTCEWRLEVRKLVMWLSEGRAALARALSLEHGCMFKDSKETSVARDKWVKSRRLRSERYSSLDCIRLCRSSRGSGQSEKCYNKGWYLKP